MFATSIQSRPCLAPTRRAGHPGTGRSTHLVAVRAASAQDAARVLELAASKPEGEAKKLDARAFRRSLSKSGTYTKRLTNEEAPLQSMDAHGVGYSRTGLVAQMRETGNTWQQAGITVILAEAYGFCWGVERAVQMAYEARHRYPDAELHITNEIIHNPSVNDRLREMGVHFIATRDDGLKDFSRVAAGDVVILPAFGAAVGEMKDLHERGVQIVDTTCPWVSKVWNAVDNQARKGHTSIIHGKWAHEETVATASFAGTYLIVKDLAEAEWVCDFMVNGGDSAFFLEKFKHAYSEGFDPVRDLQCIGMANQTTMLKGETQAIGKLLERTQLQRFGPGELSRRFMIMDTICDATQERQDAVFKITGAQERPEEALDMLLVVGGFNSSNTSHLQEIGEMKGIPSFWVDCADRVDVSANSVLHKLAHGELVETRDWIPRDASTPLRIGVTSGASTPDRAVEDVLDRIFRIRDPNFKGIQPRATKVGKPQHAEI
ncbi:IDS1 [Auxenochlorella protothecoides x Auxenochlorella symbiontica]